MSFSHEEYRVKESDGHVLIKVIISGYRKFPIQVVASSFVPTKFSLPAGWSNMIRCVFCIYNFVLQPVAKISRLENTNCISQSALMWLQSRSQYIMTILLRALKHLQSICTYQITTETDMWIMVIPSLLKSSLLMVSGNIWYYVAMYIAYPVSYTLRICEYRQ